MQPIGFHVSIEGGLPRAVNRALERECTALQVFCGNPRGWRLQERAAEEIVRFARRRREAGLSLLFVHACYLINPCSLDAAVLRRSGRRLAAELALSARMGADGYVLHPGSHKGRPSEWGVRRAAGLILSAIERAEARLPLLLENTASPHGPGGDPETLGELLQRVREGAPEVPAGVALDSCHAFGAGYDLRRPEEVERMTGDLRRIVGVQSVALIHVNDSRDPPGSRRDRHEHIGRGRIGADGLRNLLSHPAFAGLPLILETPWESVEADRRNLHAVVELLKQSSTDA